MPRARSAPPPFSPRPTRRHVLSGTGAAALTAAAVSCSSTTAKDPKTLQVWGGVPPESGPQALIDHFQEKFPDIPVKYTRFVNDDRGNLKVNTALQGDLDIDVYFTYSTEALAMRSGSGLAADLGDKVRSTPGLEPFLDTDEPKALIDGDSISALATTREPNMILFNESLRQETGIDLPASWTLEEYLDVIRTFAQEDRYGAYMLPDLPRVQLGPNYWFTSDGNSNFSDPAFEEHLSLAAELIREGVLFPWTQILARQLEAYQQNNFINQDFATWMTAPFSLRFLNDPEGYPHDFTVSCAPVPTVDGSDWNTGVYGNYIQVNAKSAKQDMAWEFVNYWIQEGGTDMAPGGKVPTLDTVDHDELLTAMLGEDAETYFEVDSFTKVLFDDEPKLVVDTDLTAISEIPQKAIETVDKNAQALIDRYQEA
jgi:multiple sugar transport system substrate-binding protein